MISTRILRLLHIFSLDVVFASMAMSAWVFFAHQAPAHLPLILALGLFVWSVYLFDHALDASRLPALGPRRQTHFKNRKVFWLLGALAITASASICLPYGSSLNPTSLLFMLSALILLLGYLAIGLFPFFKTLRQHKEFLLPAGYTFGISIPYILNQSPLLPDALFLVSLSLLIFQCVLLLAKIDANEDAFEKNSTNIQLKPSFRLSMLFGLCSILWLCIALFSIPNSGNAMYLGFGPWAIQLFLFLNPRVLKGWKMRTAIEWSLGLPGLSYALQLCVHGG